MKEILKSKSYKSMIYNTRAKALPSSLSNLSNLSKRYKKATSIKIDEDLWKEFKKYCIDKNIQISDLVEMLIKKEINR